MRFGTLGGLVSLLCCCAAAQACGSSDDAGGGGKAGTGGATGGSGGNGATGGASIGGSAGSSGGSAGSSGGSAGAGGMGGMAGAGGAAGQAPQPPQVGSSKIVFDTRAGGGQDIQAPGVTTSAAALSAMGAGIKNVSTGGHSIYPLDFVTDYDGAGTHAYRYNWTYQAGYTGSPSSCFNMNGEEDKFVYFNPKVSLGSAGVYIQWKMWRGRTTSGGGYGNSQVGSFMNSGKLMIIFRSDATHRLYFGYNGVSNGFSADINGNPQWNQNGAMVGQLPTGYLNKAVVNLNDYNNQVLTYTYWVKPESSAGAGDGQIKTWFNGTLLWDFTVPTGTSDLDEQQFGGPTWICPPQDQTHYQWDWVEWVE